MKPVIRSGMSVGLAIMCLLSILAFAVPVGNAASDIQDGKASWQPYARNDTGNGSSEFHRGPKNNETAKVEIFRGGSGFALNGNDFHVVSFMVKGKINIQPSKVRDLLRSKDINNKTLGEIKNEVRAMAGEPIYNGGLKFGESDYELININMTSAGNSSTLNADLLHRVNGTAQGSASGHIKVVTTGYEGAIVGNGELTLNGANYKVLVNMMPMQKGHMGSNIDCKYVAAGDRWGNHR